MGFTIVQKSLQRKKVERVGIGIINYILLSFCTYLTTSSVIGDKEILDLTERPCFQVKITEQIE